MFVTPRTSQARSYVEEVITLRGGWLYEVGHLADTLEKKYKQYLLPYKEGIYLAGTKEPIISEEDPLIDETGNAITDFESFRKSEGDLSRRGELFIKKSHKKNLRLFRKPTYPARGYEILDNSIRRELTINNPYKELLMENGVFSNTDVPEYAWLYDVFKDEFIDDLKSKKLDPERYYGELLEKIAQDTKDRNTYIFTNVIKDPFLFVGYSLDVRAAEWEKNRFQY